MSIEDILITKFDKLVSTQFFILEHLDKITRVKLDDNREMIYFLDSPKFKGVGKDFGEATRDLAKNMVRWFERNNLKESKSVTEK